MKKKTLVLIWVIGFLVLNLYVNFLPRLFDAGNIAVWFAYWAGFFVLAHLVCRYLLGLKSLGSLGMERHQDWLFNLGLGFLTGFSVYAIKYLTFYEMGKFNVTGMMDTSFILPMLGQALLAMFFSSILNDITIRGYWYAFFRRQQILAWYVFTATILYAFDDAWIEGIDLQNTIFSLILGLAFAYTVLKTGSIWMSLGLHWGSNFMFRVMYGFDGQGVLQLENVQEAPLYDYISLLITALMLPAAFFLVRVRNRKTDNVVREEAHSVS